jgi:plastocyanin
VPGLPFAIAYTLPDALPKNTIGEELPTEGLGTKKDPTWGKVGGFTQTKKSQVLAFPPGTTVTIRNLSKTTPHTLDAFAKAAAPPAKWPANPSLSFSAHGGGKMAVGYASGSLNPGASVKVKLVKAGTYLIGCAYHYASNHMRDVLIVKAGATPGPDFKL